MHQCEPAQILGVSSISQRDKKNKSNVTMDKTCKTCKFWVHNTCSKVKFSHQDFECIEMAYHAKDPKHIVCASFTDDDSWSVRTAIVTGPDFGCVLHEQRVVK
jgi:hypothetical protein